MSRGVLFMGFGYIGTVLYLQSGQSDGHGGFQLPDSWPTFYVQY